MTDKHQGTLLEVRDALQKLIYSEIGTQVGLCNRTRNEAMEAVSSFSEALIHLNELIDDVSKLDEECRKYTGIGNINKALSFAVTISKIAHQAITEAEK